VPELEYADQSEAYKNFINNIDSESTKQNYRTIFPYFIRFCKKESYGDMLLIEQSKLEGLIRDYIVHLKQDKKLAPASIASYVAAIAHFYEMNDVTLHWKKLKNLNVNLEL
jgi:site-specific recombinase XerD